MWLSIRFSTWRDSQWGPIDGRSTPNPASAGRVDAFFASKPVQDLLRAAESALDALPSMAARHHVLKQMGERRRVMVAFRQLDDLDGGRA